MEKEETKINDQEKILPKRAFQISHPFILALMENISNLRASSVPIEQSIRHPITADKLANYITSGHFWQVAAVVQECEIESDAALIFLRASFKYHITFLERQQERHVHTFGKKNPYTQGQIEKLTSIIKQLKGEVEKIEVEKILSK